MSLPRGGGAVLALLVALASFACLTRADPDPANTCTSVPTTASYRLRDKLLCNYDRKERPTKNPRETTEIGVHQSLTMIYLAEYENKIFVRSLMTLEWVDEYLNWDKAEFEDIDTVIVTGRDIWIPDLAGYDDGAKLNYLYDLRCQLNFTGGLTCNSPATYVSICEVDIEDYPYDKHTCSINIGSWSYYGDQVFFKTLRTGISTENYVSDNNWKLVSTVVNTLNETYENKSYNWVTYDYTLQSIHAGGYITVPAFVLGAMMLAAYATEATSRERLAIISVNILTHCFFLTYLGDTIKVNGANTPYVVLFFRDSLILAALSLLTTVLARKMITASASPPPWVLRLSSSLLSSLPVRLILFDQRKERKSSKVDDVDDGLPDDSDAWRLLGQLLDRTTLLIIAVTFVFLLSIYVIRV